MICRASPTDGTLTNCHCSRGGTETPYKEKCQIHLGQHATPSLGQNIDRCKINGTNMNEPMISKYGWTTELAKVFGLKKYNEFLQTQKNQRFNKKNITSYLGIYHKGTEPHFTLYK